MGLLYEPLKNKMKRILATFAVCVGLSACHASAKDFSGEKLKRLFAEADGDHNGQLTSEEQTAALEQVKKRHGQAWKTEVQRLFAEAAGAETFVALDSWNSVVERQSQPQSKTTQRLVMRDGVKLATDIYLPSGSGPFPVIFSRTPYHRTKYNESAEGFTKECYACVVQDMRGRFDSEGENLPFLACGWGEHQDGVDTIEWMRKQPWCDGTVLTIGGSAGGITQNLLAGAAPIGLKAQYVSVAYTNMYKDISYTGNGFRKMDVENWLTTNKFDPKALAMTLAHPSYDEVWKQVDTSTRFEHMNVPAIHVGGWFDMFAQGTIDQFVGRQHRGAEGARGKQKLVMGPWTHSIGKMPAGELTFPNADKVPKNYQHGRWFAHYAKNEDNGVEREPAVAYYVMGDLASAGAPGNEWRYASDWPIPAKEIPVFFTAERGLSMLRPLTGRRPLEYTFDPADPCPTIGGNNLAITRGPMDQRKVEQRADSLVFTGEVLDKPVEVTGRLLAKVFISSDAKDTDLSVRICDVYPDGRSILIAEGMQRLRYRYSSENPQPLIPGNIEEVTVDCWSTSIIFNQGHRVRVMVTSSNYPRFDLNPGTAEPWTDTGARLKQTNRIYCDEEHPSRIMVPVIETKRK